MKKSLILAATVLALAANSCSDKSNEPTTPEVKPITDGKEYTFSHSVALLSTDSTVLAPTFKFVVSTDGKTMDIYNNAHSAGNLPTQPNVTGLATKSLADGIYSFSNKAASATRSTFTGNTETVNGCLDTTNGTYYIVTQRGDRTVKSTSAKILSALPDLGYDYAHTTERYYEISINDDRTKADVYVYNIAFVKQMPKLAKICIPGVTVSCKGTLLTLTADKVVPLNYEGGQGTPMTSREVTDLTIVVDWSGSTASTVKFTCFNYPFTDQFTTQFGSLIN